MEAEDPFSTSCITVKANQRMNNGVGLGTRLLHAHPRIGRFLLLIWHISGASVILLFLYLSQKSISKHFSGDVLRVAKKCWQQIHPSINGAIEVCDVHIVSTV